MAQLNTIELITPVPINHDHSVDGITKYTVIDGSVVGDKYIRILSITVNNYHAVDNLEYYVLIGGAKTGQLITQPPTSSLNLLALNGDKSSIGVSSLEHETLIDAMGNYFLEHNGSVDIELEVISESTDHDGNIHCKYTYTT